MIHANSEYRSTTVSEKMNLKPAASVPQLPAKNKVAAQNK